MIYYHKVLCLGTIQNSENKDVANKFHWYWISEYKEYWHQHFQGCGSLCHWHCMAVRQKLRTFTISPRMEWFHGTGNSSSWELWIFENRLHAIHQCSSKRLQHNIHIHPCCSSGMWVTQASAEIEVSQAKEDADCLIIKSALDKADQDFDHVVVVGEDVDLLVLLCGLDSSRQNVYFQKSGRGNAPSSLYSPASSTLSPQGLLFLHAVSGCDTTSAPYGMGKKRVCSLFNRTPSLCHTHTDRRGRGKIPGGPVRWECYHRFPRRSVVQALHHIGSETDEIPAGQIATYQRRCQIPLVQGVPSGTSLARHEKMPLAWGWSLTRRGVVPITTTRNAAPASILSIVSCKCTKGCSSQACSCKKAGLRCSALCKHCTGNACENSLDTDINEEDAQREVEDEPFFACEEEENKDE